MRQHLHNDTQRGRRDITSGVSLPNGHDGGGSLRVRQHLHNDTQRGRREISPLAYPYRMAMMVVARSVCVSTSTMIHKEDVERYHLWRILTEWP